MSGLRVIGGIEGIELGFKLHDLQNDAIGDQTHVVPRVDSGMPATDEMWFEWEWNNELGDELVETAAQDGSQTDSIDLSLTVSCLEVSEG